MERIACISKDLEIIALFNGIINGKNLTCDFFAEVNHETSFGDINLLFFDDSLSSESYDVLRKQNDCHFSIKLKGDKLPDDLFIDAIIGQPTVSKLLDIIRKWTKTYAQLSNVFGYIPDAVFLVDKTQRIIFANPKAEACFKYSNSELLGMKVSELIPDRFHQVHDTHFNQHVDMPYSRIMGEESLDVIGITKDRREVFLDINLNEFKFDNDEVFICITRDITEKTTIKKEVEKKNELISVHLEELTTAHESLKEQNDFIKLTQASLYADLRYGKLIQESFNATEREIIDLFPNSFSIYKPQNHVGGDLIWIADSPIGKFIAVIDCMGHGVPGAILSMAVYNCFNTVFGQKNYTTASEFLNKVVAQYCKTILSAGGIQDTFDVSFCAIDEQNDLLLFRGIKRPIWVMRDGDVVEIKGERSSVLEFNDAKKQLWDKIWPLKKGDDIYLFSDGITDQFGGELNKKFKASRLKSILKASSGLNMQDQKVILEEELKEWMSYNTSPMEQTDDITLVGIKHKS